MLQQGGCMATKVAKHVSLEKRFENLQGAVTKRVGRIEALLQQMVQGTAMPAEVIEVGEPAFEAPKVTGLGALLGKGEAKPAKKAKVKDARRDLPYSAWLGKKVTGTVNGMAALLMLGTRWHTGPKGGAFLQAIMTLSDGKESARVPVKVYRSTLRDYFSVAKPGKVYQLELDAAAMRQYKLVPLAVAQLVFSPAK